jgi:hypothetical protein
VKVTEPLALAVNVPAVLLLIWKVQLALVLVPFTVGLAQVLLSTVELALGVIVKLPEVVSPPLRALRVTVKVCAVPTSLTPLGEIVMLAST